MPRRPLPLTLAFLVSLLIFAAGGCGDAAKPGDAPPAAKAGAAGADNGEPKAGQIPAGHRPRVLFLGTSLTAGLGLEESEAYPARVAEMLAARGLAIEVVNAGVSGDTSAGGLNRLDWLLRRPPDVVVVELGANDGLRGLPVEMTAANLVAVIERSKAAGARVILAGMRMPPSYGETYERAFAELFPSVAEKTGVDLVPFLLAGVAAEPDLNLPDGIHPNAAGHQRIAQVLLPFLEKALVDGDR